MNAPDSNSTQPPADDLTNDVRQYLSVTYVLRVVEQATMQEVFRQSQSEKGYYRACETWHIAFWKWVDQETPAGFAKRLQPNWSRVQQFDWEAWTRRRNFDWSKLPCPPTDRKRFQVEVVVQEYLRERAGFQLVMRGSDATDPETFNLFLRAAMVADKIGDDIYANAWTKQQQRKRPKDQGDRRLKYHLLRCWIPACLWAVTTDGIAAFLQGHCPRSKGKPYHPKTISDAWRELDLYRLPKPRWWGIAGQPPQLIEL